MQGPQYSAGVRAELEIFYQSNEVEPGTQHSTNTTPLLLSTLTGLLETGGKASIMIPGKV